MPSNKCLHIGRTIDAGQTGVEDELHYPRDGFRRIVRCGLRGT